MPISDDPWIATHSPIAAEKLHALGVVNFHWNTAEFILRILSMRFGFGGKGNFVASWAGVYNQKDITICNKMRAVVGDNKRMSKQTKEAVWHALDYYDVCRLNRNQLTHFVPGMLSGTPFARVGADFEPHPFPDDLKDIRRVADEISALNRYLNDLYKYFSSEFARALRGVEQPPLPHKPALPDKLWSSFPDPQGPGSRARQRRSFRD